MSLGPALNLVVNARRLTDLTPDVLPLARRYRRYAGPKVRVNNEQFIELFQVEVIRVPPPPPLEHLSTAEAQ